MASLSWSEFSQSDLPVRSEIIKIIYQHTIGVIKNERFWLYRYGVNTNIILSLERLVYVGISISIKNTGIIFGDSSEWGQYNH